MQNVPFFTNVIRALHGGGPNPDGLVGAGAAGDPLPEIEMPPPPPPAPTISVGAGADYVPPPIDMPPPPPAVAPPIGYDPIAPLTAQARFAEPMATSGNPPANLDLPAVTMPPQRNQLFQSAPAIAPTAATAADPSAVETAAAQPSANDPYVPQISATQKEWERIADPKRMVPPTYMNTNGDSPDRGKVSSDPAVVKSWGEGNAARIDEGGPARNKKWSIWEKIGATALGWATGGLGGAIQGGTDRNYFQKMNDQFKMNELLPKIAAEQGIAKNNATIANTYEDNRVKRMQVEGQLEEQRKVRLAKRRTEFFKTFPNFDPAQATPAQKAWLREIGETPESVGKYDLKDQETKTVGDTTYKWDRNTGTWKDTGLKDPTQATKTVTIIDPETKERFTFLTTEAKAAAMASAKSVAGMQIEAQNKRQITQQEWQGIQNDENRELARDRIAQTAKAQALAERKLALAEGIAKDAAVADVEKAKLARKRLKAWLMNQPMLSGDVELMSGLSDVEAEP